MTPGEMLGTDWLSFSWLRRTDITQILEVWGTRVYPGFFRKGYELKNKIRWSNRSERIQMFIFCIILRRSLQLSQWEGLYWPIRGQCMLFRQSLSLSHGSSLTKMPLLEGHFIDTHLSKLQGRKYFIIVCHTQTGI